MAKESMKARERKRKSLVEKFKKKRAQLKLEGDFEALQQLPRNSSAVRMRNCCSLTGRPRGYIRFFGLSRVMFRQMALFGKIPGVRKDSW